MADPLTTIKQRSGENWLINDNSQDFFALVEGVLDELRSRPQPERPLTILLAERDPLTFLAHFIAACAGNCRIILANPDWVDAEWQQVFELVVPDLVWGDVAKAEGIRRELRRELRRERSAEQRSVEQRSAERGQKAEEATPDSRLPTPHSRLLTPHSPLPTPHSRLPTPDSPLPTPHSPLPTPHILIPTGGTSGNIRFAIHTWDTLMASVAGFCEYFGVEQVNSFCVLPLYHVSGLMQFLRSFTTGGKLVVMPFKAIEAGDRSAAEPKDFFLSLVPTQLQRLLDGGHRDEEKGEAEGATPHSPLPTSHASIAWLSRFHTVLLGGAPAWSDLLDRARTHRIRLAPTYGMTETASQIATLRPDDFLNGHTNAGQVLPHAHITIRNPSGEILTPHQIGIVTIQATSLAWGYFPPTPHAPRPTPFQPDDLGFFDTDSYLHIIGRQTDKIITGGENVFPAEVEAAIRSTALVQDVCVIGVNDRHWGQAIAAVYVPITADTPIVAIQAALSTKLSKFKHPKHWLEVDQLPRNAQGKVNRPQVAAIAKQGLPSVLAID